MAVAQIPTTDTPSVLVSTSEESVAEGKFKPTWSSLRQYHTPEWFRDAKFGIWAHWGPQCEPERGDWYAREMYSQGNWKYREHVAQYDHPSRFGFKDVINEFKAEKWDPDKLMALYHRAGARYFFALANHHDNFDNYDSKYQPWNSVNMGPKKDLIGGWAAASRKYGLKFGVSVHAAHAWSWYETSQGMDAEGPLAGVPYDGKVTQADGQGTWWEGYDPQDLYEQRHTPSPNFQDLGLIHSRWNWGNDVSQPDLAYCQKFYNRTMDLINKYRPELIYYDDTALPLWPVSDAGLQLAAHFYNSNGQWNSDNGVLFGKVLNAEQKQCMSWDIERGSSNEIEQHPWQTCTCIGSWHYDKGIYDRHHYKSAKTVIHMLIDVVSKNGNLLLSIPLTGEGVPDADGLAIVQGIGDWMQINQEAIHGSRPWKIFGEGPQMASAAPIRAQGFNEGRGKPFTAQDFRFTTKNGVLYVFSMGVTEEPLSVKALGTNAGNADKAINTITVLGSLESVRWTQNADALEIQPLKNTICDEATVYRVTF